VRLVSRFGKKLLALDKDKRDELEEDIYINEAVQASIGSPSVGGGSSLSKYPPSLSVVPSDITTKKTYHARHMLSP